MLHDITVTKTIRKPRR